MSDEAGSVHLTRRSGRDAMRRAAAIGGRGGVRKGKPVPTNDLWIAALVVQHQLVLFDRDSDFDHLPQIARVKMEPADAKR